MDKAWPERRNRARPRATYELNVYLVPVAPDELAPRAGERLLAFLEREGIVGSYYDLGLGWLAPGKRSELLFTDARPNAPAFECLIPFFGPTPTFVPNAHIGQFGARCRGCGADLDEALHGVLEANDGVDRSAVELRCGCGVASRLADLPCAIDTAVTPFYLNFCHVDSGELRPAMQAAMEAELGMGIRVVRERL